jgi:hypothetical protein
MRDRESVLRRLEERLSRVSGWLSERLHGDEPGAKDVVARTLAIRDDVARLRRSFGEVAHEDLAKVRASMVSLRNDYDVPPPRFALRPEELKAFQRYLATTARLEPIISNLDDPRWDAAHQEYERAWAAMEAMFEPEGSAASP